MATLPPETIPPQAATLPADSAASEALAEALVALHGQAAGLALLARLGSERVEIGGELGAVIARAAPWQRALAALGTLARRGQDPVAPALVLWREFHAARAAIVNVLENPRPE